MNNNITDPYLLAYRGSFLGLRKWEDLASFWQVLKDYADDKWYIYAIGEPVPGAASSREQLLTFIEEIDTLLRQEHQEEYCGIVYVDDKNHPAFIKIYDPHNLGVVCGFSDNPPLAGWTISRLPPAELSQNTFLPQNRRRWWQKIFGGSR
jgi:hypothetical protein